MSSDWGDDWAAASTSTYRQVSTDRTNVPGRTFRGSGRGQGRGRVYDRNSDSSAHWSSRQDNFSRNRTSANTWNRQPAKSSDWDTEWGADLGIKAEPAKPAIHETKPDDDDLDFDWGTAAKMSLENEKKKWALKAPIVKNFYIESPEVAQMTKEQVEQFRRDNNNITLSHLTPDDDRPLLNPITKFEDAFGAYPEILAEIAKYKFEKPSPIQAQSWPILLSGYDLIGIAQTGTGKTLAYLLPALIHIDGQSQPRSERDGPTALIIAPTRELAQQIEKEAKKYSYRGIRTLCIYGGGDRSAQISQCEVGTEIVIATPGRLCDLVDHTRIKLNCVSYMVLDEADKMLDMGFEPEIRKIVYQVNPNRQTVLMSATWPPGVRSLATAHTQKPFQIYINTLDLAAVTSVTQEVIMISPGEKPEYLEKFVRSLGDTDKAIVFFGRKDAVDDAVSTISLKGLIVQSMHGNRDQISREEALQDLRDGSARVLFATDVASRGLDVEGITHVLNYDFPRDIEEYVHRVGRSGRAGAKGKSITMVTKQDWRHAAELIEILQRASQPVPEELFDLAKGYKEFRERREEERALSGGSRGSRSGGGRGGFNQGGNRRPRW